MNWRELMTRKYQRKAQEHNLKYSRSKSTGDQIRDSIHHEASIP